jgi:exosortase A
MKLTLDQNMQPTAERLSVATNHWRMPAIALAITLSGLFILYWRTLLSMADIWWRSETFTHGFLIFPITVFLIWRQREELSKLSPLPDYRGLPLIAGLGLLWLIANVSDMLVVQQLCFVAMITATSWTLLGWPVVSHIAFPLGFLFFAVPFGEFLIPRMMDFTADFTVGMLQLTGIPVYREGTFFSIPSGDWSVVEGCSGLRYLIASITLGSLYAYTTFRSPLRRCIFILLSVLFPVVANGLRAYMIVMIAHLSDMKLALGVDHLIYGWVFFGLVMLFMFWIGSFWHDSDRPDEGRKRAPPTVKLPRSGAFLRVALAIVAISSIWPAHVIYIASRAEARTALADFDLPEPVLPWQKKLNEMTSWEPHYQHPDIRKKAFYRDGKSEVGLYVLYYRSQEQGAELINSQNVLVPQKHPLWKMLDEAPASASLAGRRVTISQARLNSSDGKFLVWRWNWVAGIHTSSEIHGKLLESKAKLLGTPQDAAGIVLVTPYEDEHIEGARKTLQDFIDQMVPSIERTLQQAAAS